MDSAGWLKTILTWLFVIVSMLMTFFILLQEGKGGGLAALGGTKAAGVEGVTNPIRRATAYLAGLFFAFAIILGIMSAPKANNLNLGGSTPAATSAAGTEKTDAPKEASPVTTKPAETKTEAPNAEAPKTDAVKPADTKAEAPKTPETPKTEAAKPAETPKAEETKKDQPKTEEKK